MSLQATAWGLSHLFTLEKGCQYRSQEPHPQVHVLPDFGCVFIQFLIPSRVPHDSLPIEIGASMKVSWNTSPVPVQEPAYQH